MEATETRNSMTPQLYARDLAITAVICFIGGIGFALLVVLIYFKVFLRKKKKEGKMEKTEEGKRTMANQPDLSERRNHIHTENGLIFDPEVMTLDPWTCDPVHQLSLRTDKSDDQFWCSNCWAEDHRGIRRNLTKWNNRTKAQLETDEEIERRKVRMMITEHDLRRFATQQGILEFSNKLSHSRTSSHPKKKAFVRRVEAMINNREEEYGHKSQGGGCRRRNEALYCNSCHRSDRPPEPSLRKGRVHARIKDYGEFPFQHRDTERDLNVGNTSDTSKDIRIRRKSRNVAFNLESLRHSIQQNSQSEDERAARDEERAGRHNSKVQLRRLKVKLNMNPRGKRKVHPQRRNEQSHSGRSRSKKNKGKRVSGTDTGKAGKTKEKHQNKKNSANVEGLDEDGEEHKEESSRRIGQKSKETSSVGPDVPESTAADKCAKGHPETEQAVAHTSTVDQSPSDSQHPQDGCIQRSNAPPNLPASVDNSTFLRGGSLVHSTMATEAGSELAGLLTNSVFPSTAISTSRTPPNGAPGTFHGQEHLFPLANVLPANILQSPSVYASPLLATQSKDFLTSTVNSTVFQQSLSPPSGSSPFREKLHSDPALQPGPQPGNEQLPSEVHQNRENMLLKQESCSVPAVRQTVEAENGDGADLAESLPLRGVGDSMQTGEGPLLSDQSNSTFKQFAASADTDGKAANVLQQQEYLSEEGGSNPKRKLRLVLPEKTSNRPLTALERKIR